MSDKLAITIIMCTIASVLGWSVWVIAVNIRRSRWGKQVAELHSKLLDRFAGSQDLIAFLEGDAGRNYFESLAFDLKDSLSRILNSIQLGIALPRGTPKTGHRWTPERVFRTFGGTQAYVSSTKQNMT